VLLLAFSGWNDAGEAASIAAGFVNEALKAVPLADIDPEEFYDFTVCRPHVAFDEGETRRLVWPTTEFRYATQAHVELVIGIGTEPHLRWRHFADCVALLAEAVGAQRVVLLGAYLADVVYSRPVVVSGFASDPSRLETLGVERSSYEGPTGIIGVLAERLASEGREVLSLWACLPHYLNASPNPRGALALVEKCAAYLDLKLDDASLRGQVAEFEERISELVANDPELSEYVRQLKKRDFAT